MILFLPTEFLLAQSKNNSDKIIWNPTYKLKWEDFQSTPDTPDTFAAISFVTIDCFYSHENKKYYANAIFLKNLSWSKEKFRNSNILKHEQKHFDITEIYARLLLLSLKNVGVKNTYRHIYDSITTEMRNMQKQYDRETDCSRNYEQQKIWNRKIEKMLLK